MRGRGRRVLVGALLLPALLASAPSAQADGGLLLLDVPGDGRGFVHDSDTALLRLPDLAPGVSGSDTLRVRNGSSGPVRLRLTAIDVVESENGCAAPETRAGDVTCTGDGGELGAWLHLTASRVTDGGDRVLWTGGLLRLREGAAVLELDPGETVPLRITAGMPLAAGNDTMTDRVRFGLRWTATSAAGATQTVVSPSGVAAAEAQAAEPASLSGVVALPLVGSAIPLWLAVLDLVMICLGAFLVAVAARQRRDRRRAA